MDKFDRKILSELQSDGRLTVTELAERVGLSLSPCHRRLRALEDDGVIRGYRADLDPVAVGLRFYAVIFVTLKETSEGTVRAFEEALVEVDEVVHAQRLFGEPDYLMHVVTHDLPSFQALWDRRLATLPGVLRLTSTLVMKEVVPPRPLPLG
ncbi:MAG: DNA-binding transcriptional activator DecR [Luteibacter sp.]|uniref:Lrp/AsnC family transcriptional regulator n=1 Tax=Luteibacter sp. TaxID=1886636 RepID=UPI00137CECB9|nr:Lrp/AsnC family transcriptional regulator [Luteibacter sp.]KAF1007019.1 MAG: DNA-binding transcriptional activator DecR [Luteibacter sp.]